MIRLEDKIYICRPQEPIQFDSEFPGNHCEKGNRIDCISVSLECY